MFRSLSFNSHHLASLISWTHRALLFDLWGLHNAVAAVGVSQKREEESAGRSGILEGNLPSWEVLIATGWNLSAGSLFCWLLSTIQEAWQDLVGQDTERLTFLERFTG